MIASAFSLVSPNLPIGAFSYSEALESAVENKIVTDCDSFWTQRAIAMRNTLELRKEEDDKGKAFVRLISSLSLTEKKDFLDEASRSYLSAFCLYAKSEELSLEMMLNCYLFSYIESQCIAAVKLVPLGQTDAWKCIKRASLMSDELIKKSLTVQNDEIGAGLVNLSILSVKHETQYSRIFRS